MNESAIILNGSDIVKVSNLPRKYRKLINNPKIKILEECSKSELDSKYEYWKTQYSIIEDDSDEEIKLYHYIRSDGYTLTSIHNKPQIDDFINVNCLTQHFAK